MAYEVGSKTDKSCPKCSRMLVKDGPGKYYCENCGFSERDLE